MEVIKEDIRACGVDGDIVSDSEQWRKKIRVAVL